MRNFGPVSLFIACLVLPLSAGASPTVTQLPPIQTGSNGNAAPGGSYEISVLKDGAWHKAGSFSFDRFFREQRLDLSRIIPLNKTARIQIREQGGGAAHIDAVLLGGLKPERIAGSDDARALAKVSKKDNDVIDSFGKTIEVAFPEGVKDRSLVLAARIEGLEISKQPFQFPPANLFRKMNAHSAFYTYRLGQQGKTPGEGQLLFKEYSRTGTGHPAGYTWGWVSNDKENLYVKIDFTPDNTMDGDKDYAAVYVKTDRGIREFKSSVSRTAWGRPSFMYTANAEYEHKVYDFRISLRELGVHQQQAPKDLFLAFAAYGTSAPGWYDRNVSFDDKHNRYLVVYDKSVGANDYDIYGRMVNSDGTPIGAEFIIAAAPGCQQNPSVSFDSASERFLAVWEDQRREPTLYTSDIYGASIDANGHLVTTASGTNFIVASSSLNEYEPSMTYDSTNDRFLVTWYATDWASTMGINGAFVTTDGALVSTASGTNFLILNDVNNWFTSPAYDNISHRFLIAWGSAIDGHIHGMLMGTDGTFVTTGSGTSFVISNDIGTDSSVAYDSTNHRFLVSWQTGSNDIYGALAGSDGTLVSTSSGSNFVISSAVNDQISSSAVYDSANHRFLVAWEDGRNGNSDIYGQVINADGSLYSTGSATNFVITNAALNQYRPALACNSICGNSLAVYLNADQTVGMSLVGNACPPNTPPAAAALVYPANGQAGLGTSVVFRWQNAADPDSDSVTYHIYTCTDQTFNMCSSVHVASAGLNRIYLAGFGLYGGVTIFGLVFAGRKWGKRAMLLVVVIAMLGAGGMLAACSGGGGGSGGATPPAETSYTATGLSSASTYYWKVVSYDGKGGAADSAIWSFNTQ